MSSTYEGRRRRPDGVEPSLLLAFATVLRRASKTSHRRAAVEDGAQ